MIQEIVHALVQRIIHDKIIMGLLIIGILAIFMGGMNSKDEQSATGKGPAATEQTQASSQSPQGSTAQASVEPSLATDFIKWWLAMAMDYSAQTANQNHQQALGWMSQEAAQQFQSIYWTPDMANGIADGRIVAAFQPTSIRAEALNPDGSVVVGVNGTYVVQSSGQPVPYQVKAEFLVRRAQDGLRVAGVYNELAARPGSSVY
jgi:hypothetical protein